jgi:hypothetical protein
MKSGSATRKWVVVSTTSGGLHEVYHRSQPAAYREVARIRQGIVDGTYRVSTVHVKKWEDGAWRSFEKLTATELRGEQS